MAWLGAVCIAPGVATGADPAAASAPAASTAPAGRITAAEEVVHPRLLISEHERPLLSERIARSEHLRQGHTYLQNVAASLLEAKPPDEDYAQSGGASGNSLAAARWYHRHLETLAVMAYVTGDERLGSKGTDVLLAACRYQRWLRADDKNAVQSRGSLQAAAMMTEVVAVSYDLLYGRLSERQRETVRQALIEKGLRPLENRGDALSSAAKGIAALALLGEEPEAARWAEEACDRIRAWLKGAVANATSSPSQVGSSASSRYDILDGADLMSDIIRFADAFRRQTGQNLLSDLRTEVLDRLSWSVVAWPDLAVPSRVTNSSAGICCPNPGATRLALLDLEAGWRLQYADLCAALMKNVGSGQAAWLYGHTTPAPLTARTLLWTDGKTVATSPAAPVPMRAFPDGGQVVCRTGWSPDSPAAAISFHRSSDVFDAGSFQIFGHGQPIIVEGGRGERPVATGRKASADNIGQNVVVVDGLAPAEGDGLLVSAVATAQMAAVSGELAAVYPKMLSSHSRDLLLLPDGDILVLDRLVGVGGHRFDLLLHPRAPYRFDPLGKVMVGSRPAAEISVLADGDFKLVHREGFVAASPAGYLCARSMDEAERRSFLTVCHWPGKGAHADSVPRPGRHASGFEEVERGKWRLDRADKGLAVRVGGSEDDRLTCDGRLAAVLTAGQRSPRYQVVALGARMLRVAGVELLRATQPVNAAIEFDLPLRAHFWSPAAAQITLAVSPEIRELQLNVAALSGGWNGGELTFELPAGESKLVGTEFLRPVLWPAPLVSRDLRAVAAAPRAAAFQPGVRATASSFMAEPMQALDGNVNTAWTSLPGVPLPQWLRVDLPQPTRIGQLTLTAGVPCRGLIETVDPGGQWHSHAPFETQAPDETAIVQLPAAVTAKGIRVLVERVSPAADSAVISSLSWSAAAVATAPAPSVAGAVKK